MNFLILLIKGFIIGTANIIPGVSGGTIMMSLGIFEDIINCVNNFFVNINKNIKFLLTLVFGAFLSILIMSHLVTYCLDNFNFPTIIFFVGLIMGGIPMLYSKVSSVKFSLSSLICMLVPFIFVLSITFMPSNLFDVSFVTYNFFDLLLLFIIGIVAASSMVIPGLSGSFMLILFGYYEPILSLIKDFLSFSNLFHNTILLSVFGFGVLFGIFFVVKLISFLLDKYSSKTYYIILGFVISSIFSIMYTNFSSGVDIGFLSLLFAGILFLIGYFASYKLGE